MSTLSEIVIDIVKKYHNAFVQKRILKTAEEVSACTNNKNIPSATVVGELINDLVSDVYVGTDGKIHIVKGGADTGLNFKNTPDPITISVNTSYSTASSSNAVFSINNIGWKKLTISGNFDGGLVIDGVTPAGQANVSYNITNLTSIKITATGNRGGGTYSHPYFTAKLA